MVKAAQKKVISIIVTGVFIIVFVAGLSIIMNGVIHNKSYSLNFNEWTETPYTALSYGKYLGVYYSNGGTFRSYSIKGVDKNDLFYTWETSGFPWTYSSGRILMYKNSKVNPIKDWSVNKIIICKNPITEKNKYIYSSLEQIKENDLIDSLVKIISGEYEEDIPDQKIANIRMLLVFEENSGLALEGRVVKSNENFYLNIKNKYYDINTILSEYLNKYA